MNSTDISNALERHLAEAPGLPPIVWENREELPTERPYVEFQNVRVSVTDDTLGGGVSVFNGYLILTVVADQGVMATIPGRVADGLAAWFPKGHRLAVLGGGHVLFTRPAQVLQGYPDGAYWRIPVRAEYQAMGA